MLERLRRWLGLGPLDEEQLREDAEASQRAVHELRQAEQRKSEERRGIEGYSQRPYDSGGWGG